MEQNFFKRLNAGSIIFGLISLAVIGFITVSLVIKNQGIILILFSLIYVFFPGLAMLFALNADFISRYKKWVPLIAFYIGFSLLVIQYFLLNLLGFLPAIRFLPIVIGIAFAALGIKKIKAFEWKGTVPKDLNKTVPFLVLLAVVMATSYYYLIKTAPGTNSNLFMDYCYHMGNIEILTRGGSMEDIRVMGMTFKYHYFMELYYAIIRNVFPVSIWNCVFRYPVLLVSPLICGSVYNLINSRNENRIVCAVASAFIILYPSVNPVSSLLTNHSLTNINAVGVALPLTICLVEMICRTGDLKEFKYADLIVVFLLSLTLTGLKGPFAMVLIGSTLVYLIWCAVTKKNVLTNQLAVFLVMVVAFAIVWFSLLDVAMSGSNIMGQRDGLLRFFDFQVYIPQLGSINEYTYDDAKGILFIPLNLVFAFGGAAIPFVAMFFVLGIGMIRKKEIVKDYRAFMFLICGVCGIGLDYILAVAQNRVYFFMFAVPFMYFMAVEFIKIVIKIKKKAVRILSWCILVVCACFAALSVANSYVHPFFDEPLGKLTTGETDSIEWIRNNTDKDTLFAINTDYPNGNPYYYSAMTERRYYLESFRYSQNSGKTFEDLEEQEALNAKVFTDESSPEICKEIGIQYLVWFDEGGSTEILDKNYKLCFESEDVRIYAVDG